jgi:hypothetical protein
MSPYTNANATADIYHLIVIKDIFLTVLVNVLSAVSSDHLPILLDITCRPSIQKLPDRAYYTRINCAALQACLEVRLPEIFVLSDKEAIDKFFEERPAQSERPQRSQHSRVEPVPTCGPIYPVVLRTKYS